MPEGLEKYLMMCKPLAVGKQGLVSDAEFNGKIFVREDDLKTLLKKHHSTYRKTCIEAVIIADIYEDLTGEELKP